MMKLPRYWIRWMGVILATLSIMLLATAPPFLPLEWRYLIMKAFSSICHQLPERSFHIHDITLAVCHRCYGVYLGLPLAAIAYPFVDRRFVTREVAGFLLFASLGIMAVDWGLPKMDIFDNTLYSRFSTGLFFGTMAGFYFVRALMANVDSRWSAAIDIPEGNFV